VCEFFVSKKHANGLNCSCRFTEKRAKSANHNAFLRQFFANRTFFTQQTVSKHCSNKFYRWTLLSGTVAACKLSTSLKCRVHPQI